MIPEAMEFIYKAMGLNSEAQSANFRVHVDDGDVGYNYCGNCGGNI